jgi:hypothetical protein
MSRGPGPVAAVHVILIVTALASALAFAAWEAIEVRRTGSAFAGVCLALALGAAIAIGAYLRHLRSRLQVKLTPRD